METEEALVTEGAPVPPSDFLPRFSFQRSFKHATFPSYLWSVSARELFCVRIHSVRIALPSTGLAPDLNGGVVVFTICLSKSASKLSLRRTVLEARVCGPP